jgi:hypothetical protein
MSVGMDKFISLDFNIKRDAGQTAVILFFTHGLFARDRRLFLRGNALVLGLFLVGLFLSCFW